MESAAESVPALEPRAGRLLVAAPALLDPNFVRTVVLLLDVDDDGSLGVVLNRPGEIDVRSVLDPWQEAVAGPPVLFHGGPVSPATALGVATLATSPTASAEPEPASVDPPVGWRALFDRCGLVDLDAPLEVVRPALASLRIYAGYAGWGAGQLEDEIAEGAWFVVPGCPGDSAAVDPDDLWRSVLRRQPEPLAWVATYPEDPSRN